jgi:hypothetical protein
MGLRLSSIAPIGQVNDIKGYDMMEVVEIGNIKKKATFADKITLETKKRIDIMVKKWEDGSV